MALARSTASANEPAPEVLLLVTVKVAAGATPGMRRMTARRMLHPTLGRNWITTCPPACRTGAAAHAGADSEEWSLGPAVSQDAGGESRGGLEGERPSEMIAL